MAQPTLTQTTPDRRAAVRRPYRRQRRPEERVRLLGEAVDLVRPEEVLHHVQAAVAEGRKTLIANHNLHSLHLIQTQAEMRAFYDRADLVQVDSTPLIWFLRALGLPGRGFHRSTYLDWRDHFWSVADRQGWRVMSIGGAPAVGPEAARRLAERYPGAEIRTRHGFFDARPGSADNADLLADIRAFSPHILFVGMGMPRQESWIATVFDDLPACVVFSVGAAFDYEAGVQKSAPRWMGRVGLEWAYRLLHDPRRLFHRYCVEPWSLAPLALRELGAAFALRRRRQAD